MTACYYHVTYALFRVSPRSIVAWMARLAKWLNVRLRTKWLWVRIPLFPLMCAGLKNNLISKHIKFFVRQKIACFFILFTPTWAMEVLHEKVQTWTNWKNLTCKSKQVIAFIINGRTLNSCDKMKNYCPVSVRFREVPL